MLLDIEPVMEKETKHGIVIKKYILGSYIPSEVTEELVCNIASVCYKSSGKKSKKLFNMLSNENAGLPSSAFAFVNVVMTRRELDEIQLMFFNRMTSDNFSDVFTPKVLQYGYWDKSIEMWVTNYRALKYDFKSEFITELRFNSIMERRVDIDVPIYKVENMTMYTFGHKIRHRIKPQVISRRYVNSKKQPFNFYVSKDIATSNSHERSVHNSAHEINLNEDLNASDICDIAVEHYNSIVDSNPKLAEIARGIIPQCATTDFYFQWISPQDEKNFFDLRLEGSAQDEIREYAKVLKEMSCEVN